MAKRVNYMITDENITVNYDGQTHIVSRTDALADRLIKAVREQRLDEVPNLVSAAKRIENFSQGNFVVQDGKILVNGVEAPPVLGNKIVRFSNEGLPFQPLVKFAERLQKNPSYRAVQELFQFLEKNDHPITENGNFIAYKRVRSDFMDIYTGTMSNAVGSVVEMPRNQVNEDSNQTCSYGLHVANWHYAHTQYGSSTRESDIMLEVEVDPADVVAIPTDYNQSKMRVCKYTVLGTIDREHSSDVQLRRTSPVEDDPCADHDDSDEEDDVSHCEDCGVETDVGYNLCIDCECSRDEEEEEEEYDICAECGEETDGTTTLCDECAEDNDPYPWEDELV